MPKKSKKEGENKPKTTSGSLSSSIIQTIHPTIKKEENGTFTIILQDIKDVISVLRNFDVVINSFGDMNDFSLYFEELKSGETRFHLSSIFDRFKHCVISDAIMRSIVNLLCEELKITPILSENIVCSLNKNLRYTKCNCRISRIFQGLYEKEKTKNKMLNEEFKKLLSQSAPVIVYNEYSKITKNVEMKQKVSALDNAYKKLEKEYELQKELFEKTKLQYLSYKKQCEAFQTRIDDLILNNNTFQVQITEKESIISSLKEKLERFKKKYNESKAQISFSKYVLSNAEMGYERQIKELNIALTNIKKQEKMNKPSENELLSWRKEMIEQFVVFSESFNNLFAIYDQLRLKYENDSNLKGYLIKHPSELMKQRFQVPDNITYETWNYCHSCFCDIKDINMKVNNVLGFQVS